MINKYPYTDASQLNLDWFLTEFKKLYDAWLQMQQNNAQMVIKYDNMVLKFGTLTETVNTFTAFVTNYFDNLDVQQEINNKLDDMVQQGTLQPLLQPFVVDALPDVVTDQLPGVVTNQLPDEVQTQLPGVVADQIDAVVAPEVPGAVTSWLNDNVNPAGSAVVVDASLSIAGAAADAKVVGENFDYIKNDLENITQLGNQLFDKTNADTEHLSISGGVVNSSVNGTSVIIPISPSANDTYVTVHRDVISSRFVVATFTDYPEIGSTAVNYQGNNSAASITVPVDNTIKYLFVFCHLSTYDTQITVEDVLDCLMVQFGTIYTEYEPYKIMIKIEDGSITSEKFADDVPEYILEHSKDQNTKRIIDAYSVYDRPVDNINLLWISGSYYNLTTGTLTPLSGYSYTDKEKIDPGDVINIVNNAGQILWWSDNEYLGYESSAKTGNKSIVAPPDAKYYAINNSDNNYQASTIYITSFDDLVKSESKKAPAQLILDSDAFVNDKYVSVVDGTLTEGTGTLSNYYCAYPVKVKSNHKYRTATQTQLVFFDETMTFISGYVPDNDPNLTGVTVERDFTTPANCVYIAINSKRAFEKLYDLDYLKIEGWNPRKLNGKSIVCFGDSITGNYSFGDNYPSKIEEITGAKTYNCGFGGCRMELINTDTLHTNPFSMCGIVDALEAAKNGDPNAWDDQDTYAAGISNNVYFRLQILKAIDWDDIDIVTIAYGTNEEGYPQDDPNDPMNRYTYAGATRYSINKLLTLYPKLRIVLLTPIYRYHSAENEDSDTWTHPNYGGKLTDNVATLISVGHELKLPVIDMYYTFGINIMNYTSYFGDDDEPSDGTHINSFGREQFGKRIAGELNRLV